MLVNWQVQMKSMCAHKRETKSFGGTQR